MQYQIISSIFLIGLLINHSFGSPMLYKKNTNENYEADLVPISSTVIPLTVYEVSYGLGGKPSEEYKMAYLKKLRMKVKHIDDDEELEDPDTLITIKKKYHHDLKKGKVVTLQKKED